MRPVALFAAFAIATAAPTFAAGAAPAVKSGLVSAGRLNSADLQGLWGNIVPTEAGTVYNFTRMQPDGSGADTLVVKSAKTKTPSVTVQRFKWYFDEAQQELIQTVTGFSDSKKQARQTVNVGDQSVLSVKMWRDNGTGRTVLEFIDSQGTKNGYVRLDENQIDPDIRHILDKQ